MDNIINDTRAKTYTRIYRNMGICTIHPTTLRISRLKQRARNLFNRVLKQAEKQGYDIQCVFHQEKIEAMDKRSIENLTHRADVSEKAIERYLVEQAKQNGLLCLKYSNHNVAGYPDRLLVLPGGNVIWIELKSKGRKPTKLQQMRMAELTGMGHSVRVIDNKPDIDELIKLVKQ